ncbi:MAG: RdgB/HAM1 family non-canonical purine NTP pyrophosphatase [Gemmatimonadetes bacterium]|nr:RdgB/HAM1 family non-canonical purine NTP pyrophosphatase [Gemmatimonadota bacterium]
MTLPKLLIATRNPGKRREIQQFLGDLSLEIVFPDDVGIYESPQELKLETESTFEGNARAKAEFFQKLSRLPTVAEDSGIEVLSLGGAPGVRSRRFAMVQPGQDEAEANNRELLRRLAGAPPDRRGARYRSVAVFIKKLDALPQVFEGSCQGRITTEPQGTGGFGYDPLFHSHDLEKTFGQANPEEKNAVSHRGRAFRALAKWLAANPL